MKFRRLLTLLCAPLLATGLAACASTASTPGGLKGEAQRVAQTVVNLQSDATALEAKKICSDDLAAANVAVLDRSPGGCKQAIEGQLKEIDTFETTVESVAVTGARATARVKSVYAGKKAVSSLSFVRESGQWKISGVS